MGSVGKLGHCETDFLISGMIKSTNSAQGQENACQSNFNHQDSKLIAFAAIFAENSRMSQFAHRTRAQESRAAIERLYIAMRHLFIRGSYKPMGISGQAMVEALKTLQPEIYGAINDPERVELDGLLYVFQRLPKGIEECRYIRLISREGFENAGFPTFVPPKRRRSCYRVDEEQMFIEMTRGRSDIYDILTHLTFLYIEAEKIRRNSLDQKNRKRREWQRLEEIVKKTHRWFEFFSMILIEKKLTLTSPRYWGAPTKKRWLLPADLTATPM